MTIAGRTVLVTGASRGIGRALVEEALARGAARVYAGTRQPLEHPDGRVTPLILDITSPEQIQEAAGQVESLDILINNAGVFLYDDLSDRAALERHLAVNFYGTYDVIQAFLPALTRSRGAIVTIGSVAALAPIPLTPAYSVSKAAAFNLAQSLRILLARRGCGCTPSSAARSIPTWSGTSTSPSPPRNRSPGPSSTGSTTARRTSSPTPSPRRWPKAGAPASPRHSNAKTRRSWTRRPSPSKHREG